MLEEKYLRLDDLATPDGYVAPSTNEDLAYIAYFRQACKRYNIDFTIADQDERDFVIRMAEKNFAQTGLTHTPTQTAQGAHGSSGQDSPAKYPHSYKTVHNGHKTALKSFRGQLGVKRPQVQVLSLGPFHDNPNAVLQVGDVFGFIISISSIF